MRYLTHQFASTETLDRARRWLVHAGFDPSQIESLTTGVPRISIKVDPGEAAEASLIIDAAELSDPNGFPSFWDLARRPHSLRKRVPEMGTQAFETKESRSFVVRYRVPDERPELGASTAAIEMRNAFLDRQLF